MLTVFGSACSGGPGPSQSLATTSVSPTATSPATTTAPPEGTPTLVPQPTAPKRYAISNGEALPSDSGLLFVTLNTGEMLFWALPAAYRARPLSRDGRWVAWSSPAVNGNHLLDTHIGKDRLLEISGSPAAATDFSPDGRLMVLVSGSSVALVETESGKILASAVTTAGVITNGAGAFSIDGYAAQGFADSKGSRTTVVLRPDGSSFSIDGGSWPLRWSPEGRRLAVTTAAGVHIVSASGETIREISLGNTDRGYNDRWSPDGRYLAIANSYSIGGQRVFDAANGKEVLRTVGTPACLGDYWLDDGTLEYGWEGQRVSVPSGQVLNGTPRWPRDEGFSFDQSAAANGLDRLLLKNGRAVEFRSGMWSFYYDGEGVRSTTSNGEALFLIGIGGRGLCDGTSSALAVQLPPFQD